MYLDHSLLFSDKQAVTTTAASTNVIEAVANAGSGYSVYPTVSVTAPFTGLTSIAFELQDSDTKNGAFETIASTGAIVLADLNSSKFLANFGSVPPKTKKFLRMNYLVTGTASSGAITSGIVLDRQTNNVVS